MSIAVRVSVGILGVLIAISAAVAVLTLMEKQSLQGQNQKLYRQVSDDQSMLADNTSAFNYRTATGSKHLSMHAYGFAIDINPAQNPYIKGNIVLPPGAVYDTAKPGTLGANSPIVKTFKRLGWTWGGDWKSLKDYQHFEKALSKS